jgi:hypothetical protein
MNYAQLTAAIKGYCENDFPDTLASAAFTSATQIATFVGNAEERIYNSVQLPALRKNVTGSMTVSNEYLSVPSDWLANFSLAVVDPVSGDYSYLLDKDVNFIRESFPNPTSTGKPTHYAIFDQNSYILGPTPDYAYTAELHYFYYPESIVTASTTWLGDNFESALLYGSLLEAIAFMKDEPEVLSNYTTRYAEAMSILKQLAEGKNRSDTYRNGQLRTPIR